MTISKIQLLIKEAMDNNHDYLVLANEHYRNELSNSVHEVASHLSEKKLKSLLFNKLQLNKKRFDKKQFIQTACELTIIKYVAQRYPETFRYENKVNPNNSKDVDCSFMLNDMNINLEIKCPKYDAQELIDQKGGLKISFNGRVPNYEANFMEITDAITKNLVSERKCSIPINMSKHMDNNLLDFLQDANNKFNPDSCDKEINVLIVGCDTPFDIDKWVGYIAGYNGLFQGNSFHDYNDYSLVDLLLFTNLYNRHKSPQNIGSEDVFDLPKAFIVGFCNPRPKVNKLNGILTFLEHFPNSTKEVQAFEAPGNAEAFIKDTCRITDFVHSNCNEKVKFINP